MRTAARTDCRSTLVAVLILAGSAVAATSAGASSGKVQLSCTFNLGGGDQFEGQATASFDTGIPEGLVVEVGEAVPFNPFTGTIAFPDGLTDLLRAEGITTVSGDLDDALSGQMPVF